jgi:cation transport regulator ChaB
MPYSTNAELPKAVQDNVPESKQGQWRSVFNSVLEDTGSEERAIRAAYSAVNKTDVASKVKANLNKAEYRGEKVTLDKPFRLPKGSNKKFGVYVKSGDKVKRVTFGSPTMEIRRDDPKARASFRARHNCDSKTDKTTAGYWSCKMWESGSSVGDMLSKDDSEQANLEGQILKTDDEQRLVYGWASVITEDGKPLVDRQGDVIEADTMVKAVNKFMEHIRVGKMMHKGEQVGQVVHSMPLTNEIGESLGISSNREGWVVALKVFDDEVWSLVKSGQLTAFSIGGKAKRKEVDD